MSVGLLLIDIQNDYFPGGKMELEGSESAARVSSQLLEFFRASKLPIVHVQHVSNRPGAAFFLPNTEGVEIRRDVRPLGEETVIQKHYPNSFLKTDLLSRLQQTNVEQLVVTGLIP